MSAANLINANTGKISADYLPAFISNDLLSPVLIKPDSGSAGNFTLLVSGNNASVYGGGLSLNPGSNSFAPNGAVGVNIRATANGCAVEVGTDGATGTVNTIGVAGPDGVSEVYNPLYNQPMALRALTLSDTNPLCAPQVGNVGEIFRCAQAGVAAAAVAAVGTAFEVPRTGFYALQIEYKLQNAPAPAAFDINVPIAPVDGVDIGQTLTFTIADGAVVEPYGSSSVASQEFAVQSIVSQGGGVIRRYVSEHLLEAGTEYTFTLRSSSALWNIGSAGQIKAELIAQC
jgi:hypothetical protein